MKRVPRENIRAAILEIIRFRDKNEELILDSFALANRLNVHQDKVRNELSRLRKQLIAFLPVKKKGQKGIYVLFDENNPKHHKLLNGYVRYNLNQVKTMYFNDIVKYLPILKDDKLKTEIGQMYFALGGDKNE